MADISIDSDSGKFKAGDGQDLNLYHNGTNSFVENETGILYVTNKANTNLIFGTNNTTAVTIDSSQNATFAGTTTIGSGTAHSSANDLIVGGTSSGNSHGITIASHNDDSGRLLFSDNSNLLEGQIIYDHSTNTMTLGTAATTALTIDSSQKIGIGTSSPSS